jgi:hypothetical protein
MNKEAEKTLDRITKMAEATGALKVINTIQDKFRQSHDGSIHATYDEWAKFITPFTELPK